jgi:hypothetical protein
MDGVHESVEVGEERVDYVGIVLVGAIAHS